jgi:hypothetical protein
MSIMESSVPWGEISELGWLICLIKHAMWAGSTRAPLISGKVRKLYVSPVGRTRLCLSL